MLPSALPDLARNIGGTPLQTIVVTIDRCVHKILLKREDNNPIGSIKDRTAYGLLTALEKAHPGQPLTVVESTSGNLGAALATLCHLRGHTFMAVVDPKAPQASIELMRKFGAQIHVVEEADKNGNYLDTRIRQARELCAALPKAHWTNQYSNRVNPSIHYRHTAPEILRQSPEPIDAIFVAVSTGGTLRGISDRCRLDSPGTRIVAVDVQGSIALGGTPGPRSLNGIGANRQSRFITRQHYNEKILITDSEAIVACRRLLDETGTHVGGSSGAAVAACLRYLVSHPATGTAVCVCPDGGSKYADTLYSDAWLESHGIDLSPVHDWFAAHRIRLHADVT
ncbi:MAG TPA: pyridoxal-phosphate dependent enzyme [Micromonosporaceae bacterium]